MRNKLYVGLLAIASTGYLLRRLGKRWGATDDEAHRSLPGDDKERLRIRPHIP